MYAVSELYNNYFYICLNLLSIPDYKGKVLYRTVFLSALMGWVPKFSFDIAILEQKNHE